LSGEEILSEYHRLALKNTAIMKNEAKLSLIYYPAIDFVKRKSRKGRNLKFWGRLVTNV
jgi:hypothetical protein